MRTRKPPYPVLWTILLAGATTVGAETAHVHGHAELNLVLDGGRLHVEFVSPAANLIGFEHPPRDAADDAAVEHATLRLEKGDALFSFPGSADCRLHDADVQSPWPQTRDASHHEEDAHEHTHTGHASDRGREHADFGASYAFDCRRPQQLSQVRTTLFDAFPALQQLDVQAIVDDRQFAARLTPATTLMEF